MKKIVRIADMAVGKAPEVISTYGLGSCVAVILYDPDKKQGGVLHFVLPERMRKNTENPLRYGEDGVRILIREMERMGSKKGNLRAKIVGGSTMFASFIKNPEEAIGKRNVRKAREILEKEGIRIVAEDTGGDYGRSLDFYLNDGRVVVKSYARGEKVI